MTIAPSSAEQIAEMLRSLPPELLEETLKHIPPVVLPKVLSILSVTVVEIPPTPLAQAREVEPTFRDRPHLQYLSDRIAAAVEDVKGGKNRFMRVSMPPRMGKSTLGTQWTPAWLFRQEPAWDIGAISHGAALATKWGRNVRSLAEKLGVEMNAKVAAASEWETAAGGSMIARGIAGDITGRGVKVLIIDDAVKGFTEAHSATSRQTLWDKWLADIYTRLEPPYLVLVIGTRWHENDFIGRLSSSEYEGNPDDWEVIEFPAIAEVNDVLGRAPGEPLLHPMIDETPEEALARWEETKASVGSYKWAALYQQRPSPAKGAIFDMGWWRYWTTNPDLANGDNIVYIDFESIGSSGRWLDSWDCAFKGSDDSDYVVGQRWLALGAQFLLIDQSRARRTFTETVEEMYRWRTATPYANYVAEQLVEDKANGTAVIDVLKRKFTGLIPINPTDSKVGRARAVTPVCEAGNVLLPLPSEPGNEWVADLLDELRNFPTGAHDDCVDALTQALSRVTKTGPGSVRTPGEINNAMNQPGRSRALPGMSSPFGARVSRAPGR